MFGPVTMNTVIVIRGRDLVGSASVFRMSVRVLTRSVSNARSSEGQQKISTLAIL